MRLLSRTSRLLSFGMLCLSSLEAAGGRPNVLIILADDLGFSDLGCYGSEMPTPHLDRLAAGGARFAACYNSARCCPSRAALMTGLYPHEAGVGSFATARPRRDRGPAYTGHLLADTVTLAEILGDAGYSTWMVGKWHLGIPGPVERGFQNYYGYKNLLAHSENQWDPAKYVRLPAGIAPEHAYGPGGFYATDVFTDYALEFLRQARTGSLAAQPWFLYLAHSSPHFPVQAPKDSIDRHVPTYRQGWDILRQRRFTRQKKLGLVPADAELPPLSEVPVDRDDIANGFSGKPNPAWDRLPAERREDLARRGATFAAMVGHVDRGVGRILADLDAHGELDNTLILFTSDNGACYEWGPFGFDGRSRLGQTTLHTGDKLAAMGQAGTHSSYGSGWANLGNTPLNMYKHFCHEGGIASPLIVHWPGRLQPAGGFVPDPVHIMDIVPTVCEATGTPYPRKRAGRTIKPLSGTSLLPVLQGKALPVRTLAFEHQGARGLRRGDWKIVRGKRQRDEVRWELFDLREDRFEQNDLAPRMPEVTQQLVAEWEAWARRVGAEPFAVAAADPASGHPVHPTPEIRHRPLTITCDVTPTGRNGVIVAQGGREHGYALHLLDGHLALDVRVNGTVTRLAAPETTRGRFKASATITADDLTLSVNGRQAGTANSPGLIPVQPKDGLSVGHDSLSAAGNYKAPNPLAGTIHQLKVTRKAFTTHAATPKPDPGAPPDPPVTAKRPATPALHGAREPDGDGRVVISGELKQWHKVTLHLDGPYAHEQDNAPNPFTDRAFNVTFTHASGDPEYVVPGYFAADGKAAHSSAESGTVWKAHLSPDKPGKWSYTVGFSTGKDAALDGGGTALAPYCGKAGSFMIAPTDKTGRDFRAHGRLSYVGKHVLQFQGTMNYFLKVGADAPETLLGYKDFDGTRANNPRKAPLKTFAPHLRDWKPGDPSWKNGKGKGLIGALNYLSSAGANAFSFLPYNAGGDGDNVWPFTARDDKFHYDCSKLDQWGIVFDHATAKGLYLHFKMQETEMDDNRKGPNKDQGLVPTSLDGGRLGPERKLYCRELIARFGHALALNWNIGEENTQTTDEIKDMIGYIRATDPYDHHVVLHTYPDQQDRKYGALLGYRNMTGLSIQNSNVRDCHHQVVKWVRTSAGAKHPWVVAFDEPGDASFGMPPDDDYPGMARLRQGPDGQKIPTIDEVRKYTLWGTFMAGGAGVEYYFGYKLPQNDLLCEDWRSRDQSWKFGRIALDFLHGAPVHEMTNRNGLIGNPGNDNSKYCLARDGELYLVYLPNGGGTSIVLPGGNYRIGWFNPRTGESLSPVPLRGAFISAPDTNDWLAVIRK